MSEQTRRTARLAAAGLVVVLTLPPEAASGAGGLSPWCLVCGSRGTADLILNVLLFVPLGGALARPEGGARSVALALGIGALLSGAVEAVQLLVPGRHTALADLIANTAGATAGGALAVTAGSWLRPGPGAAGRLAAGWGVLAAAVLLGTSLLLSPALSTGDQRVQWAPALEQLATFPGRVLEARLADDPLRPGELADPGRRRVRTHLGDRRGLATTVTFGPPPPSLAPIFRITDDGDRDLLILGQDGPDLVYRLRRRADAVLLQRPEHRAQGLLAGTGAADTLRLGVRQARASDSGREEGTCLEAGEHMRCGLGFRPGRGWALLLDLDLPTAAARGLDAAWVGGLFLPLGFWYRRRSAWGVGTLIAGAGLLAAPSAGPVLAAGWAEAIGVVAGLAAGLLLRAAQSSSSSP